MRYMIDVRYGLMSTGSRVDVKDIHEARVAAALALSLAAKVSLTEALFSLPFVPYSESEYYLGSATINGKSASVQLKRA